MAAHSGHTSWRLHAAIPHFLIPTVQTRPLNLNWSISLNHCMLSLTEMRHANLVGRVEMFVNHCCALILTWRKRKWSTTDARAFLTLQTRSFLQEPLRNRGRTVPGRGTLQSQLVKMVIVCTWSYRPLTLLLGILGRQMQRPNVCHEHSVEVST